MVGRRVVCNSSMPSFSQCPKNDGEWQEVKNCRVTRMLRKQLRHKERGSEVLPRLVTASADKPDVVAPAIDAVTGRTADAVPCCPRRSSASFRGRQDDKVMCWRGPWVPSGRLGDLVLPWASGQSTGWKVRVENTFVSVVPAVKHAMRNSASAPGSLGECLPDRVRLRSDIVSDGHRKTDRRTAETPEMGAEVGRGNADEAAGPPAASFTGVAQSLTRATTMEYWADMHQEVPRTDPNDFPVKAADTAAGAHAALPVVAPARAGGKASRRARTSAQKAAPETALAPAVTMAARRAPSSGHGAGKQATMGQLSDKLEIKPALAFARCSPGARLDKAAVAGALVSAPARKAWPTLRRNSGLVDCNGSCKLSLRSLSHPPDGPTCCLIFADRAGSFARHAPVVEYCESLSRCTENTASAQLSVRMEGSSFASVLAMALMQRHPKDYFPYETQLASALNASDRLASECSSISKMHEGRPQHSKRKRRSKART